MKKAASIAQLTSAVLISLGAFEHSFAGVQQVHAALDPLPLDPKVVGVIFAVWYFAGIAMFVLGLLVLLHWNAVRTGRPTLRTLPLVVSLFYVAYGIATVALTGNGFFWVFVVLGALLGGSSTVLLRGSPVDPR